MARPAHRTVAELEASGMRLRLDTVARRIDVDRRELLVTDAAGGEATIGYEKLVLGTGAVSVRPRIDGLTGPDPLGPSDGVHLLHSMGDTFAIMRTLEERWPASALIVGAVTSDSRWPTRSRCAGSALGDSETLPMLKHLAQDLNGWRLASGRPADSALVFPRRQGGPWREHTYRNWRRRVFQPAALAVGLPESSRPYDLRHSLASLLYAEGRNPAEIAKIMGHSVETLSSTYTHVIEELEGQAAKIPPSSSHTPVELVVTFWSHKIRLPRAGLEKRCR